MVTSPEVSEQMRHSQLVVVDVLHHDTNCLHESYRVLLELRVLAHNTCTPAYIPFWSYGEILGFKVPQNGRFPAHDAPKPPC